ncbi:MAG: ATP-dependent RecD-like DNA helicase [Bacteroidia bacterium]
MTDIFYQLIAHLPEMQEIELTEDQQNAVTQFLEFFKSGYGRDTFLMTGSAGTGKTLLIHLFTVFLKKMGYKVILLAPTGRAAKVITRRTGKMAYTIHHHIFSVEEGLNNQPSFSLRANKEKSKVVYIIDEASMIGDVKDDALRNGLLQNLLYYVFENDENRKLMLVGDPVQLPPIGDSESPALNPHTLKQKHDLNVFYAHLNEVKRQAFDSLVLDNAVVIRDAYTDGEENPSVDLRMGRDVQVLDNAYDALETYIGYFEHGNLDKVVFLTYSNQKATQINQAIRKQVMETNELLVEGDLIMVVRNNYCWGGEHFLFLANGEMGTVLEVMRDSYEELYGLRWMDTVIGFEDSQGEQKAIDCKVVLDLLENKLAQLSQEQVLQIWQARQSLYFGLPKGEATKLINQDPYINGLQIKYGYAITGHKSQGGQWENVLIAFEPNYGGDIHQYLRWTYTVFTRAEERVFMLGCPFLET